MNKTQCNGIVHVKEHMREGHKVGAYDRKCGRHNHNRDMQDIYSDSWPYNLYQNDKNDMDILTEKENQDKGDPNKENPLITLLKILWGILDDNAVGYLRALLEIMNTSYYQELVGWLGQFGFSSDDPALPIKAAEFLASEEGQAQLAAAVQNSQPQLHEFAHLSNIDLPYTPQNLNIKEPVSARYANLDDVVQLKGTLGAMGYYTPSQNTGMTPIFDNELQTAIKEFQKDNGFPQTGGIHPNGIEMETLNAKFTNPLAVSSQAYINGGGTHNYMTEKERIQAIIEGRNVKFNIEDNIKAKRYAAYESPPNGLRNIQENETIIDTMVKKYNIDNNLVKAIMYMEGADGHKFGLNEMGDRVHLSSSVMPMNIQHHWGKALIGNNYDPYNKTQNIEAGVKLIKRISESIENPTPAKIGTLWNGMMKDSVSDVGARVGRYYDEKPWENIELIQKEGFANYLRNNPRSAYKKITEGHFKRAKTWEEFGKLLK